MRFDPKVLKLLNLGLSGDRRHLVIRSAADRESPTEYSFGIEEEYFLADATTLAVAIETPDDLFEAANWSTGGQAMREMLQAQLEVATNVHLDAQDALEELKFLRSEVAKVAAQYGLVIMGMRDTPDGSLAPIATQPETALRSDDRGSQDDRPSQHAVWDACARPAAKS